MVELDEKKIKKINNNVEKGEGLLFKCRNLWANALHDLEKMDAGNSKLAVNIKGALGVLDNAQKTVKGQEIGSK